jgi:hypothetical protein
MAKHNNRIQTIENNREINHENGVHLPPEMCYIRTRVKDWEAVL